VRGAKVPGFCHAQYSLTFDSNGKIWSTTTVRNGAVEFAFINFSDGRAALVAARLRNVAASHWEPGAI
jgi:hypothetical protein